jgi:hypothetical protein
VKEARTVLVRASTLVALYDPVVKSRPGRRFS